MVFLLSTFSAWAQDTGTAQGTLTVAGQTVQLKYAYAKTIESGDRVLYCVKLSDVVLGEDDQDNDVSILEAGKARDVSFCMEGGGEFDGNVTVGHKAFPDVRIFSHDSKLEVLQFDKSVLEGKFSIDSVDNGIKFSCKASFRTGIDYLEPMSSVKAEVYEKGKPLPKDGGIPGKNYLAFNEAYLSGNYELVKKIAVASYSKDVTKLKYEKNLPIAKDSWLRKIKVVGGAVEGNRAILSVTGVEVAGEGMEFPRSGTVLMEMEGNEWKYSREKW